MLTPRRAQRALHPGVIAGACPADPGVLVGCKAPICDH